MAVVWKVVCGLILILFNWAAAQAPKAERELPAVEALAIGRHTYFDAGPPFDFYEVFVIESAGAGVSIERVGLTPQGHPCIQPATVEIRSTNISQSISELLGGRNPCAIPARELRKELERCKKCLVFSGADVAMQVKCGDQSRRIRIGILDRDMFDHAPRTPEYTSWTMALLNRLDGALGASLMDQPAFVLGPPAATTPRISPSEPRSKILDALKLGRFDALFENAPHKPSAVYAASQNAPVVPSIEIVARPSVDAISYALPRYPPLARAAHIEGKVAFTLDVASDGTVSKVKFDAGHPILQKAVESEVTKWKFPGEAAGQTMNFTIEFKTHCPSARR